MSPALIEIVKMFEGYRSRAYRDAVGIETIGYGHVITRADRMTWYWATKAMTEPEATKLLTADLDDARRKVLAALHGATEVTPTPEELDALTSFVFNLGGGALGKSTLLHFYLAGDRANAADQFRRWVYAGSEPLAGLRRRREAERALFLGASPETVKRIWEQGA